MKLLYILLILSVIILTIYFVIKSRDFRKFLAGAFFVSGGIQLYLAVANVSIPVLGTDIVQGAELGYARGAFHLMLFLVFLYFGFIKKPKVS
jgi:multisubunit Na+/H+ antiporter MnhC subunit